MSAVKDLYSCGVLQGAVSPVKGLYSRGVLQGAASAVNGLYSYGVSMGQHQQPRTTALAKFFKAQHQRSEKHIRSRPICDIINVISNYLFNCIFIKLGVMLDNSRQDMVTKLMLLSQPLHK